MTRPTHVRNQRSNLLRGLLRLGLRTSPSVQPRVVCRCYLMPLQRLFSSQPTPFFLWCRLLLLSLVWPQPPFAVQSLTKVQIGDNWVLQRKRKRGGAEWIKGQEMEFTVQTFSSVPAGWTDAEQGLFAQDKVRIQYWLAWWMIELVTLETFKLDWDERQGQGRTAEKIHVESG